MSEPLLRQALQLHQAGHLAAAEPLYRQALATDGQNYPALYLLGQLLLQQGNLPEAILMLQRALALKPDAAETLAALGAALASGGRGEEALPLLRRAAAALPQDANLQANLGALLQARGAAEEALPYLDAALALAPGHAAARTNRGLALRALNRHAAALADLDAAVGLAPQDANALINRAALLWSMDCIEAALADYDAALAREPDAAAALRSRANLLWTRREALEPALADLTRLARLKPDDAEIAGELLHLKMHAGDWTGFEAARALLDAALRAGQAGVEPYIYQGLSDNAADLQQCARLHAARHFPPQFPLRSGKARRPGPIRIGYVSGEFRAQATAYLTAGLYEAHDRSRFEVIAFDNSRKESSPTRARLEAAFGRMIDITTLSDREAAARVAAEEIDILVNLNGWFGALRMGVFAFRPAPVQVNYLGFPGTLGAPYMDYILADAVVVPEGEERFFTEQVLRLPHSYQINDDRRAVPPPPPPRAELGLPPDGFVFAHFNYSYKITPAMFALWLRLLAAAPGSVLWLLETSPLFARNIRARAAEAGIDQARILFAPVLPLEQHMARLAAADLFLDSLPYGAHTTGSDALWAGLPLLTCRGRSFAGRVGASLLAALEMPELITENLAAYEARALELARDPAQLGAIRARLREKRAGAPLFDTAGTTRAIEAAYQQMFDRWQQG
jgi:predicted O-linked N-acetylglucosamine transferase (SPINDLY family)